QIGADRLAFSPGDEPLGERTGTRNHRLEVPVCGDDLVFERSLRSHAITRLDLIDIADRRAGEETRTCLETDHLGTDPATTRRQVLCRPVLATSCRIAERFA